MFATPSSSSYEHHSNNRVAAARSMAAAAALATVGQTASPSVVYRLIEQADRKNKVMSADPRRTLVRTLLQRRHFQVLRDAASQVERAHQAELMREQQRLQERIFNLRFQQQSGHAAAAGHPEQQQQQQQQMQTSEGTAAAATTVATTRPMCGPIGIARPAHFNAALLRTKDSQGWPSNQWTVASVTAPVAVAVTATAPAPAPVPAPATFLEEGQEESTVEEVTFESNTSSSSVSDAFEQEWMEVTSSAAPTAKCTITFSTTTTTTTPFSASLSTSSSSFFGLPCGTAGLSKMSTTGLEEVNQQPASTFSSAKPHSRVVAAPQSEGRGWGCGGKRSACSSSFVGSAKKIREDFDDEGQLEQQQENCDERIGFASSPFQWQSLFDQSQLQQVLCN